jgi:hypothetical protein
MLSSLLRDGLRFDAALAIWVLQHSHNPASDIGLLRSALKPAAGLFVLNNIHRAIPTKESSWINDLVDVKAELQKVLVTKIEGRLSPDQIAPDLIDCHFWGLFC